MESFHGLSIDLRNYDCYVGEENEYVIIKEFVTWGIKYS